MIGRALIASFCLLAAAWSAATAADLRVEQVESGLFPTAATRAGATATIQEQMVRYGVPGVSIAVIDEGRIAWAKGYGVADSRTVDPVTTETMYQAASISKPLTALAAVVFVDKGKLELDQDVNRYLKSWKIPENDFTRLRKVTLRMLLNHTSGIGEFEYREKPRDQSAATLLDILNGRLPATNLPVAVSEAPGRSHSYSKAGYDILQQLLIDVGGSSFDSVMRSTVLDPLGMTHSGFETPSDRSNHRVAAGHLGGGTVLADSGVIEEEAAAGLWSTPTDLARYLIAVQSARRGESGALISQGTAADMLTPDKGFHGLGPVISGHGPTARFGHDGFNSGFEASVVGYIDRGQGAVIMANSNLAFVLIVEILESIARAYAWPQYDSTNMWPPEAPLAQQVVTAVPADIVTASTGEFRTESGQTMKLFRNSRGLFINMPLEGDAKVFAADGKLFCPPLQFSELGSPWLLLERENQGAVSTVRAGYQGFAEFRRVN